MLLQILEQDEDAGIHWMRGKSELIDAETRERQPPQLWLITATISISYFAQLVGVKSFGRELLRQSHVERPVFCWRQRLIRFQEGTVDVTDVQREAR